MNRKRIEKIQSLLNAYYESEDSFEQTDLAINLIQGHIVWLMEMAKTTVEMEGTK